MKITKYPIFVSFNFKRNDHSFFGKDAPFNSNWKLLFLPNSASAQAD